MLIKNGQPAENRFAALADDAPLPASGAILVSLKRFQAEREMLLARKAPVGVRIESGEPVESLGADAQKLALVVLAVPYFRDGRAYSSARVLRTRLSYTGEIRVTGHYLRDQIAFFARVGVDAFELDGEKYPSQKLTPADIAAALKEISYVYQPSVDGRKTIHDLRLNRLAR